MAYKSAQKNQEAMILNLSGEHEISCYFSWLESRFQNNHKLHCCPHFTSREIADVSLRLLATLLFFHLCLFSQLFDFRHWLFIKFAFSFRKCQPHALLLTLAILVFLILFFFLRAFLLTVNLFSHTLFFRSTCELRLCHCLWFASLYLQYFLVLPLPIFGLLQLATDWC